MMIERDIRVGATVILDDADGDLLSRAWHVHSCGYIRQSTDPMPYMHRLVLERKVGRVLTKGERTDHINGNCLDNRRDNLRVANASQNAMNMKPGRGVYCVSRTDIKKRWVAKIMVNYRNIHLGYFATEQEAIAVRQKAECEYFGEYRRGNHA